MLDIEVGVVGRPGVVHGDPAEPAQDSGGGDALAAAFGVAGDQSVLAGPGAMHPRQRARHPQPGLIEPGHLGFGDPVGDFGEEPVQAVGGALGHRRDGAFGDRGAEQLGQRLAGALLREELPPT